MRMWMAGQVGQFHSAARFHVARQHLGLLTRLHMPGRSNSVEPSKKKRKKERRGREPVRMAMGRRGINA